MTPLTPNTFTTLDNWNFYQKVVKEIENEKYLFNELLVNREKYILRIHAYNGDYKGMALIADSLRYTNRRLDQTKKVLKALTERYCYILTHMVK